MVSYSLLRNVTKKLPKFTFIKSNITESRMIFVFCYVRKIECVYIHMHEYIFEACYHDGY